MCTVAMPGGYVLCSLCLYEQHFIAALKNKAFQAFQVQGSIG